MRKFLACCCFLIATPVVVMTFLTATTYIQLTIAIISYILLSFLALKAFPRTIGEKKQKEIATPIQSPIKLAEETETEAVKPTKEEVGIVDIDKRAFLKLVGGIGFSLFLFSIFNKKAEGLFFKNVPSQNALSLEDADGKIINPAERQPMDGYKICEVDDNVITFYGFTNKDGAWLIMKEDTDTGSFRYIKGDSNFPGNWTGRENLTYDYFHNVF